MSDDKNVKKAIDKTDWQRRSALLDEVSDLPKSARAAWFEALEKNEPAQVASIKKMLADFDSTDPQFPQTSQHNQAPILIGVGAREFEARLDVATSTAAPADVALQPGDSIGAWQLERKIGEGGMGAVWLAARHDGNFNGVAAIKFLRTGLGKTEVVARFLRERRLLARLTHPGIARMLDAGTHAGEPYLVMEYVDGEPITDWAAAHAPRVAERVALILKVCRAAEHAHGQLVVHRDLKPSNVLVTRAGEPSLLDFGIAKLIDDADEDFATALTRMTGRGFTLGYCAPEQITGEPTGVAADVFSMGVLLFELLTGTLPFNMASKNGGRAALEHAIVHDNAKSISKALDEKSRSPNSPKNRPVDAARAKGDLEAIVAKALRKNPADRYPTLSAFAADLDCWLNNLPVAARRGNWQYKTGLWLKRNRTLAAVISIAFVAVSVGLLAAIWQADRANTEAERADLEKETAVQQRRLAEISTAQANAALSESELSKTAALAAQRLADESAHIAGINEKKSRAAERAAAQSSQVAESEAAKAMAVNQFLITLFEGADPERAKGEKLLARDLLDAGTKKLSEQFASAPDTLAELQAVLGRTYASLSQPQRAIPLLTEAAAASAKRNGIQSVEYARNLHALAMAEIDAEKFVEAEQHFRAALPILEKADGEVSDIVILGKCSLAAALQKQGKLAEIALIITPLRERVIQQRGDKSWAFAEIENVRAVLASARNDLSDERAILLAIEPLFLNPPPGKLGDALSMRGNLAVSYARGGQLSESLSRLDGVITGLSAHLGFEADRTMVMRYFAAEMTRQLARYPECAKQYAELAATRERITGPKHPLTVDVLSKAAMCFQFSGQSEKAADYMAKALAALPANDDPPQRTVARTLMALSQVALDQRVDATAMIARGLQLTRALNLAPDAAEVIVLTAIQANAAAQSGNTQGAAQQMDTLVKNPRLATIPSARTMRAYLLAINGQTEAARAEAIEARAVIKARFPEAKHISAVLDYVDALTGPAAQHPAALNQLAKATGRTPRLPLSAGWFGF